MRRLVAVMLVCLGAVAPAGAHEDLRFTLHKLESGKPGPTLLVVGGIQGDEPGGFNAAALLVTHYTIKKGNVWVVPNLNFISIINRSRGVYGDLNRKFAVIRQADPEFDTIAEIKKIILEGQVDMVLNLHDGSGFYRPRYVDAMHNPNRWGQSVIIDQEKIAVAPFGNLGDIARQVVGEINQYVRADEHSYRVKNTKTYLGDRQMEKTLTYYAVRNLKPAFGVEVSKAFPTYERTYYHLRILESYMELLGIEYERNFELSAAGVDHAINSSAGIFLYGNRIFLEVANARRRLGFVPFRKAAALAFRATSPLVAVVHSGGVYKVYRGNRTLTRLYPQYFEYDFSIDGIAVESGGVKRQVRFGAVVGVRDSFLVLPRAGYRANIIGFRKPGRVDESGITIRRDDIEEGFSVDRRGQIYRVEVYRGNKFSGMVLVDFGVQPEKLFASQRRNPWRLSVTD